MGEVRLDVMIGRRSFLAEMFKEALERIARRNVRYFEFVAKSAVSVVLTLTDTTAPRTLSTTSAKETGETTGDTWL